MSESHEKPISSKLPQEMVRGWLWACVPKTWVEWLVVVAICLWLIAIVSPGRQSGPYKPYRNLRSLGDAYLKKDDQPIPFVRDVDQDGVAFHGWQTLLLPQLGYAEIFEKIDLARPWNDQKNLAVFQQEIPRFHLPVRTVDGSPASLPKSEYPVIQMAGNQQVMNQTEIRSLEDLQDGSSQTLLMGEINSQLPPWGKPGNVRDPAIGLNHTAGFGPNYFKSVQFVMADGSVKGLHDSIDAEVLKALASPNGQDDPGEF